MTVTRVVVVGADAAGMSAAHQALRTARKLGRSLQVTALERTPYTSYSACGIPYWVAGDVAGAEDLVVRTPEQHRERGVDLRMGAVATHLDLDARVLTYRDEVGTERSLPFDELVLATGAAPHVPDWARDDDGSLVPGVHPVKDLGDGEHWSSVLTADAGRPGRRHAVVLGGGYLGLEMAEAVVRRDWDCTLITRSTVMSSLDPDMGERIQSVVEAAGVTVRTHCPIDRLERGPDGRVAAVLTADGTSIRADAVVLALGVAPSTELGRAAGLPVGASGGYLTAETGRLADGVWAAGDCCEVRHRVSGRFEFVPLGTHANKQGRVVGTCLGGGSAAFAGVLGTAITRFAAAGHEVEVARTGLSVKQAAAAGLDAVSMLSEGRTAAGYMPEGSDLAIKVVAEVGTRRLLGMQIVGGPGAAKRIDTAAAALWGELTVDDLVAMDLAYAPPFATVWEAVQLATRRLADTM